MTPVTTSHSRLVMWSSYRLLAITEEFLDSSFESWLRGVTLFRPATWDEPALLVNYEEVGYLNYWVVPKQ